MSIVNPTITPVETESSIATMPLAKALTAGLRKAMADDPTKYRLDSEVEYWKQRDPITRYETWLRSRGEGDAFFADVAAEGEDVAADVRKRTLALGVPSVGKMFDHVYSEPHPVIEAQQQWLAEYEASLENDG